MISGIGIDIEEVKSFEKNFEAHKSFFQRIFSDNEIAYCKDKKKYAQHFAARFCAKEALVKAVGALYPVLITDVEVGKAENGAPCMKMRSDRQEIKDLFLKHDIHLSMSHTDAYACATVVIEQKREI